MIGCSLSAIFLSSASRVFGEVHTPSLSNRISQLSIDIPGNGYGPGGRTSGIFFPFHANLAYGRGQWILGPAADAVAGAYFAAFTHTGTLHSSRRHVC